MSIVITVYTEQESYSRTYPEEELAEFDEHYLKPIDIGLETAYVLRNHIIESFLEYDSQRNFGSIVPIIADYNPKDVRIKCERI